jgi:hypothetical protein
VDAYVTEMLTALAAGLHERVAAVRAAGHDPALLGSPGDLAKRMLAAVPATQPWDEQIGPFYDTAELTAWLGISKQALNDRVRRSRMLAVTTADGRVVYPARQFDGRQIVAGLADALAKFRGTPVDGWAIAAWLTTPAAALRGKTPLDWLHHGNDAQRVAGLAEETARWAA